MSHRFDQVLDAIVANLVSSSDVGGAGINVYRGRTRAVGDEIVAPAGSTQLPAVAVYLGEDEPLSDTGADSPATADYFLTVYTDVWVRSKSDSLDQEALKIRRRLHRVMMADQSQGLSFVSITIPNGADEPIMEGEGNRKRAAYRITWTFRLRTNLIDPGDGPLEDLE